MRLNFQLRASLLKNCCVLVVLGLSSRHLGSIVGTRGLVSGWPGTWAPESMGLWIGTRTLWLRALAQQLQCIGVVTLKHVESWYLCSSTRGFESMSLHWKMIPNYCTTSKVPQLGLPENNDLKEEYHCDCREELHFLTCYVVCHSWLTVYASIGMSVGFFSSLLSVHSWFVVTVSYSLLNIINYHPDSTVPWTYHYLFDQSRID